LTQSSIRKDFQNFVKSPDYLKFDEYDTGQRTVVFLKVFVIRTVLLLVPAILLSVFEYFGLYNGIEMISTEIYNLEKSRNSGYTIYIVILCVIIMPVLEEIGYRLPLKKFEIKSTILAVSSALGIFIAYLVAEYLWWPKGGLYFFLTNLFYFISIIGILYVLLNLFSEHISKLKNFWNKNPPKIFYFSVTLFTLMHIFNLNIEAQDLFFLPLILVHFLIDGVAFGYLRIRLGLIYSIVMHVLINVLSFAFV